MCQNYVSITLMLFMIQIQLLMLLIRSAGAGISSLPDFLDINEPASILLNSSLVAGISCGDDLHGVKHESAPTLSARVKSNGAN